MEPNETNAAAATADLAAIVTDVLGDLAFLVSDDQPREPSPDAAWLECCISYAGPQRGTLRCWCTRGFAVQLATNLLGLEPDDEAVRKGTSDALCEFMNVVCGQLVTAWHGTDPVFNLSIPTVVECREPPQLSFDHRGLACALSVSGEPFYCAYE